MDEIAVIGSRVEALREARGLAKGQLAYKADTTTTTIGRVERNERPGVEARLVAAIALALDTTVEYLVGITDDPRPIQKQDRLTDDDIQAEQAGHLLRQLPHHRRPEALDHLRVILDHAIPERPALHRIAEQPEPYDVPLSESDEEALLAFFSRLPPSSIEHYAIALIRLISPDRLPRMMTDINREFGGGDAIQRDIA